MPVVNFEEWNQFIRHYPHAHLLQQSAWGKLKADFGWQPEYILTPSAGAQILFRPLPAGFSLAYIPKGPLGENWAELWPEVDALCRSRNAVFLKVEPDAWEDQPEKFSQLEQAGFIKSRHDLQPPRTIVIDLNSDEEEILARMKQKTRYNIRLAGRKDVTVEASSDLDAFCAMMEVTGERDEFGVHTGEYYRRAYQLFHDQDDQKSMCELLIASYQGTPLAGLMVFACGKRAWYLYGASNNKERNRMPTYLIQSAAIQWARQRGCTEYDLWGVPDYDEDTLEAQFSERSDGLWGVYRFKRGFGGQLKRSAGAYDKIYRPLLYKAYQAMIARRSAA
jgi:lipid II:glycine glycyltransferase (peptidoglycan interpeptide bridge formation enzyme)